MIEIREMTDFEIDDVLRRVGYGHLGCSLGGRPYVVPINYAYDKSRFYIYTGEGKKAEILRENSEVCLQIESADPSGSWQSVVINGQARLIADPSEKERVLRLVISDPAISPALGITWVHGRACSKASIVFEISADAITGLSADKVNICAASAQPTGRRKSYIY